MTEPVSPAIDETAPTSSDPSEVLIDANEVVAEVGAAMETAAATEVEVPLVATPSVPDRADAPVSETVERFLRSVIAQVPVERIEELHLFSPLRQGTIETGIAVLAARAPEPLPPLEPELPLEGETDVVSPHDEGTELPVEEIAAEFAEPLLVMREAVERHTVYTARYRYVIKGPERGKWEADLKAEADAPLITVETVVRGVQRRAGEESEIVRYTGAQIAKALRLPATGAAA